MLYKVLTKATETWHTPRKRNRGNELRIRLAKNERGSTPSPPMEQKERRLWEERTKSIQETCFRSCMVECVSITKKMRMLSPNLNFSVNLKRSKRSPMDKKAEVVLDSQILLFSSSIAQIKEEEPQVVHTKQ